MTVPTKPPLNGRNPAEFYTATEVAREIDATPVCEAG